VDGSGETRGGGAITLLPEFDSHWDISRTKPVCIMYV